MIPPNSNILCTCTIESTVEKNVGSDTNPWPSNSFLWCGTDLNLTEFPLNERSPVGGDPEVIGGARDDHSTLGYIMYYHS
jgi:hypothetical protein